MANYLQEVSDKFHYIHSCELNIPFRIKIGTLEGQREKKSVQDLLENPQLLFSGLYQSEHSDLYVTAQVFANGKSLTLPTQTAYKAFSTRWNWNEWLLLPIHFKDVPRNAVLALTIYDIYGPRRAVPVGGTTIPVFGRHGCLRRGIHDLRVWLGKEADGSLAGSTPGEMSEGGESEMMRLSRLVKKHRRGRMMRVDWLDRLTYREIEVINEREKRSTNYMYLTIEFPAFHFDNVEHAVVFFEPDGNLQEIQPPKSEFLLVNDMEWNLENLVELKHHRLTHSLREGAIAKELKPNTRTRDHIARILSYPPTHELSTDENSLIWQFRYYLTQERKALAKFVQSIDWQSKQEADEAVELMYRWQPLDTTDALELLTRDFKDARVRKYAISRLQCADNDELLLYLLQLVQALRYETPEFLEHEEEEEEDEEEEGQSEDKKDLSLEATYSESTKQRLEQELAEAAQEDHRDESGGSGGDTSSRGEGEEGGSGSDSEREAGPLPVQMQNSLEMSVWSLDVSLPPGGMESSVYETEFPDLTSFLLARASRSTQLANYFYWYLSVECTEGKDKLKYERIRLKFLDGLKSSPKRKWRKRYHMLTQQELLLGELKAIMATIASLKEDRPKRIEKLRNILLSRENLLKFKRATRLPLDPHVLVVGIDPDHTSLFKSALMPSRFGFRTDSGQLYSVMFKLGDDLRQDQLILQLIMLMDRILRRENLDLKLTPYNVLACSSNHGFIQLVDQTDTLAHVLQSFKNIQNFFRHFGPMEGAPYGIDPDVMDTYVKSCAGYCVITYLLGVGDRHNDNLLLSESGHLIHVDFGYILGRDCKPFPPPMKLNKEMVEAMGGMASSEYQKFREHCYNAFLALRRSANLILNLFSLMLDAGVPDIALEPDKTVQKIKDKFCLDLNEEEAVQHIQSLIDESVKAMMAVFVEQIHKWAQYWRK